MTHPDSVLDPVLQPTPARPGHHSIQDIQASQILSHFQFAPAGSPAAAQAQAQAGIGTSGGPAGGGSSSSINGGGASVADGGQQQQQQQAVFDQFAAFPAVGDVVGSDGTGSASVAGEPQGVGLAHHPSVGVELGNHLAYDPVQRYQGGRHAQQQQQQQARAQGYGFHPHQLGPGHQQQHLPAAIHHAPPPPQHDPTLKRPFETYAGADDGGPAGDSDPNDADVDEVQDLAFLRREVKRLRRALRHGGLAPPTPTATSHLHAQVVQHQQQNLHLHAPPPPDQVYYAPALAAPDVSGPVAESSSAAAARRTSGAARKNKKADELDEDEKRKRNALTGKRESTPRHHALNKAIRDKMKELMGVGSDERLPSPHDPQPAFVEGYPPPRELHRPDWKAGVKSEANKAWLEGVARSVINDGWDAARGAPTSAKDSKNKIPTEDLDFDLAYKAARTAFSNFAKKWVSQTDPAAMQKAIVDAKRGRRWARKDLKQKKRSKAALDQSYASLYSQQPYPHILKLDYMSSECSSEGDDAGLDHGRLREGEWEALSGRDPNPELNKGKGEKVLEIRTPRWRSERLTEILSNLDDIAALQAKAVKGNFYTAPALRRFKLHPLRDLPIPSVDAPLEAWEFDPTWLAQPTDQVDEIRRKLGLASIVGIGGGQQQQQQQQQDPAIDQFGGIMVGGYDMMGMAGLEGYAHPEAGGSQ